MKKYAWTNPSVVQFAQGEDPVEKIERQARELALQAKDEFAGRKLKCPQCQNVLQIPMPAPASADEPSVHLDPTKTSTPTKTVRHSPLAPPADPPKTSAAPTHDAANIDPTKTSVPTKTVRQSPLAAPTPDAPAKRKHPWVDRSLEQTATPWQPGDEERLQKKVRPMKEGTTLWTVLLLLLVVAGAAAAAWYYWPELVKLLG